MQAAKPKECTAELQQSQEVRALLVESDLVDPLLVVKR